MRPKWLDEYQNRLIEKYKYRNLNGTFAKGNPGGPGRPRIDHLKRAGIYRKYHLNKWNLKLESYPLRRNVEIAKH